MPARRRLGDQQHQAAQHQHAGQHAAGRAVERRLELLEDRGGEGVEAHHRECPEFGEQMNADQQPAAEDRQPQLGQHHPEEHPGRTGSQCTRRLLNGGVEPAQRRGRGQVHEREVRQCRDEYSGAQPVQGRDHAHPGVAVDECRYGQRRNEQRAPGGAAGQVGPFHQPGHADPDDHTQRHRDDHQSDRVAQQFAHPWPREQLIGLRPPCGHERPAHIAERDEGGGNQDRDGDGDQRAGPCGGIRPRDRRGGARDRGSYHL